MTVAARHTRQDMAAAVAHLRRVDADLGRLIDAVGPCGLSPDASSSTFAALARAIVHQQLSGRAAATIFQRFCALFPSAPACPTAEQVVTADDERLRACGLSRSKQLSLRDLARRSLDGTIPSREELQEMDDEALITCLAAVRGVGRWTAEMFLIFHLGRPDVLPLGDQGLRRGFASAFGLASLPTPADVAARGVRWAPYRTVASWYLWRAAEGGGLLGGPAAGPLS
jgi:3-methyladenine DNA glycosylase/8-oxoguanine DNA glycosylase